MKVIEAAVKQERTSDIHCPARVCYPGIQKWLLIAINCESSFSGLYLQRKQAIFRLEKVAHDGRGIIYSFCNFYVKCGKFDSLVGICIKQPKLHECILARL